MSGRQCWIESRAPVTKRPTQKSSGASSKRRPAAGSISRRTFVTGAGLSALFGAAASRGADGQPESKPADGTPEQIHLTWGEDPASSVCLSWASAAQARNPRVRITQSSVSRTVHAVQRTYTDGLNGQTVFTYHASLTGLKADSEFHYSVSADNDRNRMQPFAASFRTAPRGRKPFRWTSYGDLATPNHCMDTFLRAERLRGQGSRTLPTPVSLAERRSVLREPQSQRAARGVGGFWKQCPSIGCTAAMDALPRESRDRIRQRRAGLRFVSHSIHAAVQRHALSRIVVSLSSRLGAVYFTLRRRCHLPGQRSVRERAVGLATRAEYRQCADRARHLSLYPWI